MTIASKSAACYFPSDSALAVTSTDRRTEPGSAESRGRTAGDDVSGAAVLRYERANTPCRA